MRNAKIDAIEWASNMLEKPFVILDTETTGLHDGEIVSISVINHLGETLLDTLVKPVRGIPQEAINVHGITMDMVSGSPGFESVARRLLPIITGRNVVIYNAVYDRKMLHQSAEKCGMEKIDWKTYATFHCAMEWYAQYYGDWNSYHQSYRWQKLTHACEQLGIDQGAITAPAHSALGDCLRTLALIKALAALTHPSHEDDGDE